MQQIAYSGYFIPQYNNACSQKPGRVSLYLLDAVVTPESIVTFAMPGA
jgi:hypothetical protein